MLGRRPRKSPQVKGQAAAAAKQVCVSTVCELISIATISILFTKFYCVTAEVGN